MPTRPEDAQPDASDSQNHVPDHSGYAERGPGRRDHPGRGAGERVDRKSPAEREASDRSRWRTDDRDERSERWNDNEGPEKTDPGI